MNSRPWAEGTHDERWNGYFIEPGSDVLRNNVGATTSAQLRDAENDLVEARLLELRADTTILKRTYDLPHLLELHRHLFQDVYEWAGEVRTVGLSKGGGDSFVPPLSIEQPVAHVAVKIAESDLLRAVPPKDLPRQIAYLYDYLNYAHPFREGNGRAQRVFFDQLAAESDHGLSWHVVDKTELHDACHSARNSDDLAPMLTLFNRIVNDRPVYPRSR